MDVGARRGRTEPERHNDNNNKILGDFAAALEQHPRHGCGYGEISYSPTSCAPQFLNPFNFFILVATSQILSDIIYWIYMRRFANHLHRSMPKNCPLIPFL
ncbi:hypothetical protein M427DRAFT_60548 [Gonapodya prolifera JEL478]|uniref:Uncharacterized protein n=1 Tax=Gonapodya prolifera (strain JEL478) TaxID=1344416 RepID=A0A139A482_GONPJ|nr:hypothetical protein M427DRAFT_60548 [Gonapodya prolifera JEL478]|eukprot:KXS11524.1 hypothetical protein M427DRAFT_60548 [Gonapodya prolifera JEL478]